MYLLNTFPLGKLIKTWTSVIPHIYVDNQLVTTANLLIIAFREASTKKFHKTVGDGETFQWRYRAI